MNTSSQTRLRRRHWLAWTTLCGALAVHVTDEALTGFLQVYNPTVRAIRAKYPLILLPTFTFEIWLSLLIFAVLVLMALSFFVWAGKRVMRPISYVYAGFMLVNGLMHIASSIYTGELMPGVYSSPLLLAASIALIAYTPTHSRDQR